MATLHDLPRTIAVCDACGKPIASVELEDGTLLPIGTAKRCTCGSDEFRRFR